MRNELYKVVAGWVLGIGVVHAGVLLAPSGFYAPHLALTARGHAANCPPVEVYQGDLSFPSKYEGNGPAKDTINPEANAEFESLTKPMTKLQQLSASWSDKVFKGKGSAADLACVVGHWRAWADARALETPTKDVGGRSVRKWTLGAVAANYLKLSLNLGDQLAPADRQAIERWLGALAEQVRSDYDHRRPDQINNHDYWAEWSVMTTAVILQRQDLFDWAWRGYQVAMGQVTDQGYLPNELKRKSRALGYHSFALMPLTSMAAFAETNHFPALVEQHQALGRLVQQMLDSLQNPQRMVQAAGSPQVDESLREDGRLAWLVPWYSLTRQAAAQPLISELAPLRASRLGGDLSYIYLRDGKGGKS